MNLFCLGMFLLSTFVAVVPFVSADSATGDAETCVVRKWVDGDTANSICDGVGSVGVRLEAVNAGDPYWDECMSREAKQRARGLAPNDSTIWVQNENGGQDTDGWGRLLRAVYTDEGLTVNIGYILVREGLAKVPRHASDHPRYAYYKDAQKAAKADQVGMWAPGACP